MLRPVCIEALSGLRVRALHASANASAAVVSAEAAQLFQWGQIATVPMPVPKPLPMEATCEVTKSLLASVSI